MRGIRVILSFLLTTVLLLTSCKGLDKNVASAEKIKFTSPPTEISVKLDIDTPKIKEGLDTGIDVPTYYVKFEDINPEAVPEIKLGLSTQLLNPIIRETTQGFLCGYIPSPQISVVSKYTSNTPKIRKLDKAGKVLWEKEYDYKVYSGKVNNIVAYPDESFIFSVQTYPYNRENSMVFDKSFIIKCDKDGKKLWKRDFDDYSTGMLSNLFITGSGDIIAVGQWRIKDGKQAREYGADDIVITKLDSNGNILKQKSLGGSDFDSFNTARYDKELGIIISGRTQSKDGDFAMDKNRSSADFIACIDEELRLKWVSAANEKESFIYDQLVVSDGFIYVPGSYIKGGGADVAGFLIKLDKNGKRLWTKSQLYVGFWGRAIDVLKSGEIIIGSGQQNKGTIVILDKDGIEKRRIEGLKYAPNNITPTGDGGYIVTAVREIKPAPQPAYISSIWYDTELFAVKYKSDHSIEWQKTYDWIKDERGFDFVLPLKDGRLIIEGIEN